MSSSRRSPPKRKVLFGSPIDFEPTATSTPINHHPAIPRPPSRSDTPTPSASRHKPGTINEEKEEGELEEGEIFEPAGAAGETERILCAGASSGFGIRDGPREDCTSGSLPKAASPLPPPPDTPPPPQPPSPPSPTLPTPSHPTNIPSAIITHYAKPTSTPSPSAPFSNSMHHKKDVEEAFDKKNASEETRKSGKRLEKSHDPGKEVSGVAEADKKGEKGLTDFIGGKATVGIAAERSIGGMRVTAARSDEVKIPAKITIEENLERARSQGSTSTSPSGKHPAQTGQIPPPKPPSKSKLSSDLKANLNEEEIGIRLDPGTQVCDGVYAEAEDDTGAAGPILDRVARPSSATLTQDQPPKTFSTPNQSLGLEHPARHTTLEQNLNANAVQLSCATKVGTSSAIRLPILTPALVDGGTASRLSLFDRIPASSIGLLFPNLVDKVDLLGTDGKGASAKNRVGPGVEVSLDGRSEKEDAETSDYEWEEGEIPDTDTHDETPNHGSASTIPFGVGTATVNSVAAAAKIISSATRSVSPRSQSSFMYPSHFMSGIIAAPTIRGQPGFLAEPDGLWTGRPESKAPLRRTAQFLYVQKFEVRRSKGMMKGKIATTGALPEGLLDLRIWCDGYLRDTPFVFKECRKQFFTQEQLKREMDLTVAKYRRHGHVDFRDDSLDLLIIPPSEGEVSRTYSEEHDELAVAARIEEGLLSEQGLAVLRNHGIQVPSRLGMKVFPSILWRDKDDMNDVEHIGDAQMGVVQETQEFHRAFRLFLEVRMGIEKRTLREIAAGARSRVESLGNNQEMRNRWMAKWYPVGPRSQEKEPNKTYSDRAEILVNCIAISSSGEDEPAPLAWNYGAVARYCEVESQIADERVDLGFMRGELPEARSQDWARVAGVLGAFNIEGKDLLYREWMRWAVLSEPGEYSDDLTGTTFIANLLPSVGRAVWKTALVELGHACVVAGKRLRAAAVHHLTWTLLEAHNPSAFCSLAETLNLAEVLGVSEERKSEEHRRVQHKVMAILGVVWLFAIDAGDLQVCLPMVTALLGNHSFAGVAKNVRRRRRDSA